MVGTCLCCHCFAQHQLTGHGRRHSTPTAGRGENTLRLALSLSPLTLPPLPQRTNSCRQQQLHTTTHTPLSVVLLNFHLVGPHRHRAPISPHIPRRRHINLQDRRQISIAAIAAAAAGHSRRHCCWAHHAQGGGRRDLCRDVHAGVALRPKHRPPAAATACFTCLTCNGGGSKQQGNAAAVGKNGSRDTVKSRAVRGEEKERHAALRGGCLLIS